MSTLNSKQQESFRDIIAWLRGGDITPNPEMEEKFIDTITGMVIERIGPLQKSLSAHSGQIAPEQRPRPISLKALMREVTGDPNCEFPFNRHQENKTPKVVELSSTQATTPRREGIDSVALARTLLFMAKCNNHPINISQIQIILYIAYGIYLVRKEQPLTDEHPQMWEYGPVFPKAYNHLRKRPSDGKNEADNLKESNPDVYRLMESCFRQYAWTSASALSCPHTASGSPWESTRKKSPDKWGVQIDDQLISEWFSKRMNPD